MGTCPNKSSVCSRGCTTPAASHLKMHQELDFQASKLRDHQLRTQGRRTCTSHHRFDSSARLGSRRATQLQTAIYTFSMSAYPCDSKPWSPTHRLMEGERERKKESMGARCRRTRHGTHEGRGQRDIDRRIDFNKRKRPADVRKRHDDIGPKSAQRHFFPLSHALSIRLPAATKS